jgi:hypothetical protein
MVIRRRGGGTDSVSLKRCKAFAVDFDIAIVTGLR